MRKGREGGRGQTDLPFLFYFEQSPSQILNTPPPGSLPSPKGSQVLLALLSSWPSLTPVFHRIIELACSVLLCCGAVKPLSLGAGSCLGS